MTFMRENWCKFIFGRSFKVVMNQDQEFCTMRKVDLIVPPIIGSLNIEECIFFRPFEHAPLVGWEEGERGIQKTRATWQNLAWPGYSLVTTYTRFPHLATTRSQQIPTAPSSITVNAQVFLEFGCRTTLPPP